MKKIAGNVTPRFIPITFKNNSANNQLLLKSNGTH